MPFIVKNIDYLKPKPVRGWRSVALATWGRQEDPTIHGVLDIEMENALAYLEKLRSESGKRVTVTAFLGKVFAEMIRRHPEFNSMARWGNAYPRRTIDIFFQIAIKDSSHDLNGVLVKNADQKSLFEIATELERDVPKIRRKGNPLFERMRFLMALLPRFLARPIMNLVVFLLHGMNLSIPSLGLPVDGFGSMMLTNVGALGVEFAFPALVPFANSPLIVAVGAICDKPVARNGQVVVGKVMKLGASFDHRIIDGIHGSLLCSTVKKICEDPARELS